MESFWLVADADTPSASWPEARGSFIEAYIQGVVRHILLCGIGCFRDFTASLCRFFGESEASQESQNAVAELAARLAQCEQNEEAGRGGEGVTQARAEPNKHGSYSFDKSRRSSSWVRGSPEAPWPRARSCDWHLGLSAVFPRSRIVRAQESYRGFRVVTGSARNALEALLA